MNTISRRQFVQGSAAGLAGLYVASQLPGLAQASPFPNPKPLPLRRPEAGLVEAEVAARVSNMTVNGRAVRLLTYGGLPGPTLRVREGDTVRLNFTNNLPEVTNLHLHGLHVSPGVDDPLAEVQPGESRLYEFTLPKGSAGTFWYHPHIHGKVAEQLFAGLAGFLIVEGPPDSMPELAEAEEQLLVLKDWAFAGGGVAPFTMMDWMNGKEGNLVTVNAAQRPTLRAQKATQRLRVVNASNARYYRLALEGHPLYLIGTDGGFVEKPVELTELLLAPGERADLLVRLTRAGSYRLQALPYDRGAMMMHGGMGGTGGMGGATDNQGMGGMDHGGMNMGGQGNPSGAATGDQNAAGMQGMMGIGASRLETLLTVVAPANPRPLPLPTGFGAIERLNPAQAAATRRIEFGERMMQAEFFFNGRMFDAGRVDITAKLGTLEVWELVNKTDMDHPFHLHTYPFQVLSRNGKAPAYRAWKDVVNLKKDEVVRIAVPVRDFAGVTVYHCHIVEHEDRGMMGVLKVEGSQS
ncbi:multicopper oxidase family protein [uncultured Meiothermus sp.]|jgi:FtsP/CotA-like multicopper oxidase with cupredoxin domain|uniref:multicopper oxidase family protein n=1 Tax=uncultured Meiothermus sp. TaxID=157471 RepID=UPI002617367F|nr:multicopper oxidase family protein [uncultured Meiothermus sp.]